MPQFSYSRRAFGCLTLGWALGAQAQDRRLAWGFDLDWSLIRSPDQLGALAALWQPLGAPIVTFPGLTLGLAQPYDLRERHWKTPQGNVPLNYLFTFLRATQTIPLLVFPGTQEPQVGVSLVQQILAEGRIPYVLVGGSGRGSGSQLDQLKKILPLDRIGAVEAPTNQGLALAYVPRQIVIATAPQATQRREVALALRPFLQDPCWFLGVDAAPTDLALQMYMVGWLVRQKEVSLTLAGDFMGTTGLVDLELRANPAYTGWREQRAMVFGS